MATLAVQSVPNTSKTAGKMAETQRVHGLETPEGTPEREIGPLEAGKAREAAAGAVTKAPPQTTSDSNSDSDSDSDSGDDEPPSDAQVDQFQRYGQARCGGNASHLAPADVESAYGWSYRPRSPAF